MSYFYRHHRMQEVSKAFQNERTWDESKVTRGKTTPESNSGSFAPSGAAQSVADVARDALADAVEPGSAPASTGDLKPSKEMDDYYRSMVERGHLPKEVMPKDGPDEQVGEGYKELQRSLAYKPPEKVQVGAILSRSWGYEQTNVNYYEVTGMSPSGKTATLRELAQIDRSQVKGAGPFSGGTRALPGAYIGKPFTKRIRPDGKGTGFNSYSSLSLWDGKDDYVSWGH